MDHFRAATSLENDPRRFEQPLPDALICAIIGEMTDETVETQASTLCKACGLCCTGHLFIWVKLKPAELDPAEALGLQVYRSDPTQRGFSHPCPLWKGQCTIHESVHYPRMCRAYRCKMLREMQAERLSLAQALRDVEQAKGMFANVQRMLPPSSYPTFRERMVACLEHPAETSAPLAPEFQAQAEALVRYIEEHFGVMDFLEPTPGEEQA